MKRITLSFLYTSFFFTLVFSQGVPEVSSLGSFFYNEGGIASFTVTYTPVNPGDVIEWDFGDSAVGSGATVTHTYADNGTYNLSVTVTNSWGTGSATGIVYISNVSPSVTVFSYPPTGTEGQSITFNGAGTDPGTLDVLTYTWYFGDGESAVGTTVTHTYVDEGTGTYTVTLLITDGQGGNGSQTGTISISNVDPVISQLNFTSPLNESSIIEFNAVVNDVGTSDILTYEWDYGDGSTNQIYTTGNYVTTLDGAGDYLQFSSPISNALSQFTVEIWVKGTGGTIFSRNSSGIDGFIQLGFNSTAQFTGSAGTMSINFDGIPQNIWSHVAMSYDGSQIKVFVDGNLIAAQSASGLINASNDNSFLGRLFDGTDNFTGQMTDFRFWNSARSQTQIRTEMGTTLLGNESGLLAYNKLDQGSGTSSQDETGNGHSLTLNGDAGWISTGGRHSYSDNGTYTVSLTVTDGDNGTHTISNGITIENVNPTILTFNNPGVGDEGQSLSFSTYAICPGSDVLTYTWDFGDNTSTQTGDSVTHAYADDGTYTITLTIIDENDGLTTHQSDIVINNVDPTISTVSIPDMGTQGTAVHFTANATDPGSDTPVYSWDFGDTTPTSVGPDLYHTYTAYGTYTVTLTVTEEDGGTVSTTSDITIVPDWNTNYSSYQSTASMTAVLYLDYELQGSPYNKVAAFYGDETRGTALPILVGSTWMYFITLYANVNGESLNFKAYIADQELVLDVMETIVFSANNSYGSPLSPFSWNTILNYDHNPQLSGIPDQTIEIGGTFTPFDLDNYLIELDGNQVSYLYLYNVNLSLSINSNHVVFVTPVNSQWTGSETIRFIVTDETDAALLGFQDVTFTIEPIDNPPEILAISDETVGKVRNFTSFDLDNYLVELDGDDVSWSFEYSTPVLGDPAPSWTINPNAFQFSMTVTAAVTVRNRITDNGDYILAAFSGGELRGVTSPVNVGNGWVYFLTLYSNVNSQPIEFSLYDPVIGDIIPVKETVIFEINGVVGNPDNPYVMNAGNILASLDADNIISFEILKESWYGTESIDFIVTDSGTLHAFSGTETASYTVLDDYYPIVLTIPDQIIEANNSFQEIDLANYLDSPDGDNVTWSYSGNNELLVNIAGSIATVTHPNQRTIVWTGAETITFIATDQTSNQLTGFSSATFTVVDIDDPPQLSGIPDQTVGPNLDFSSFDLTNYLTELNGDDVSWAYQFNIPNTGDNYPGWSVQASSYEMSATVTAVVNSRGLRAGAGNFQLGAFFGDEVRGAADPIQFGNDYLYFLTVFSNVSGQTITFKFYDALNGDVVPVNYSIDFVANAVLGNPQSPLELDAGNLLVDLSTDGVVQIQKVGTGWVGSEEIIFTVTDIGTPNLHSGSDAASFTVLPDNNPIVNQIPGQEIEVGTNFTDIDLSQYLTELDGDGIYWTSSGGSNIQVTINGNIASLVPTVSWIGMETISFIAHDDTPTGLTGSSSADFRVRGEDHIPGISDIPGQTIGAGGAFTNFDLDDYLNEIDGDPVQWSYEFVNTSGSSLPPDWTVNPADFEMSMNITSRVNIRGEVAGSGNYLLGAFSNGELRGVASPVLVNSGYFYFVQAYANINGETLTFQFFDAIVGDVVPVFETVTFMANTVIGNPTSPLELHAGNIIVNLDSQNFVSFEIINNDWSGTETISFTAQDVGTVNEYTNSDSAVFTIDADHTPIISGIADQTINEGASFSVINLNNYIEEQDNDVTVITYSGNSDLTVNIDSGNLLTIGIPNADWYGSETITFTITDQTANAFFDTDVVTFTVNNINDRPTINQIVNQTITEDSSLELAISASDIDSPNLFYSAISDTNGVSLSITPTLLTITTTDFSGVASILVSVNDGSLAANTSFYLTVTPLDDPPTSSDMDLSTNEDVLLTGNLDGYDGDGDQLTYSIVSGSSHGTLNLTDLHTGAFTFDPDQNFNGTDNFTYKVETDARYAINFNGLSDFITIDDSPELHVSSFTIEAWIKPNGIDLMSIISKLGHPEEASGGFDLSVAADGKLYGTIYYLGNQYFVFSNNTLAVGEWNHVAMSWIGDGDLTLYINGEYEGSFNAPIGSITNTAPVKIGVMSWNNTRYFNGQIDVVRMWGTARSQIEILSGMYGRMDVNEAGLVSAWRMDEGSGTVVSDLTSNNNDGTLSGGTWEVVDPAVTSNTSTAFITIQPVNDSPSFTKGSDQVVNEDSGETTVADWATLISAGPLDELSQTLHFEVTTDNDNLFSALPAVDPNGELTFTPANDMYGTAIVSVVLYDDGGTARSGSDHSVAQTFNITINPVNDEPMFVISSDLTVNEDDGSPDINIAATAKTIPDFISSIDLGPQNEITDFNQTPDFSLTTNNDGLFEILPEINSGGTLTYQLAHNNYGTAEITVVLNDGGGTDNNGDDSSVGTFQISVNPVNDFPSFTIGENQSILEDDGNTSITEAGSEHLIIGWATNIDLGPENEITDFNQNATFILTTDNDGLFSVLPTITPSGDLSYTSALNQYGDAIVTIVLSDNGGTDFGGVDTTQAATFNISVLPVNDQPTIVLGADIENDEDDGNTDLLIPAAQKLLVGWASNLNLGPANEVEDYFQHATITLVTDYDALFSELPVLFSNGTLRYTLALNMYGTANVTMTLVDNGGVENGGVDTFVDSFTVTVNPVNDKPSFVIGSDITENEDDGSVDLSIASSLKTMENWITGLVLGPQNEVDDLGQNPTYTLTTDNDALFNELPAISPSGTLTYQPGHNQYGSAVIQIVLNDNGGTEFGGDDEFIDSFTITVNPVNDEPSFTMGVDIEEDEDDGSSDPLFSSTAKLHSAWATDIVLGPDNEITDLNQTATFEISTTNDELFAQLPTINADGDLTYQIAQNKFGNASISIILFDNGGTEFGGDDQFAEQTFQISILPINDAPLLTEINGETWTENSRITILEDESTIFTITALEVDTTEVIFGSSLRNVTIIVTDTGEFNVAQVQIIPEADWFGELTISVFATDEVYFDHNSFILEAVPVNDAPSYQHNGDVTYDEDNGSISINNWAHNISMGPDNEILLLNQYPTFSLTTDNDLLFTDLPGVDETGTLTFSLADNANGSANVSIFMIDNGGTDNEGIDSTSTSVFTISVLPINDPVEFIEPIVDFSVEEDATPDTFDLNSVFTDIDLTNGSQENLQFLSFMVLDNSNPELVSAIIAPDSGLLTTEYTGNLHGTAQLTIQAMDNVYRIENSVLENVFSVTVNPIPDTPNLTVNDVITDEDTSVDIIFDASLNDIDGSETISFQIEDLPMGTIISDISENRGNYQFQLTPTENSAIDFTFSITAIATEVSGETATLTDSITVSINPIPDMPILIVENQSGIEDSPIPLQIQASLTDTDGSEYLYILIPDFPEGTSFNHSLIPVQGYGYLIQSEFLSDFALIPPPNSDEDFWLNISAVSFESQLNFISVEDSIFVTVDAIADTPELIVNDVETDEDVPVEITFFTSLSDLDGSETLSIEIGGLPDGAEMSDLISNGDNSYTFTVTPPLNDDSDFILEVTSTSTEVNGGDFRTNSANILVTVNAVADLPLLIVQNSEGIEDTDIALNISAELFDVDGSESLAVYISDLSPGAVLSSGTLDPDNSYTLLPSELQDLYITPAPDEHDFILTITAEAVEEANQNTIVDTQSLYVTIIPVNDDPFLSELADIETDEDVDVSFTIQGTDVDIETDGQELQFSCISSDEVLVLCDIVNLRGTVDMTLNLDVQDNRHGTADITVIVDDQFSNRAIDSRTFTLTVNPVPDTPNLTVSNSTGDEDTEIPINIESSLVDTDGSEQLVVFIDNIPDGSVITEPASIVNEHFVYTPDQLPSLQILPPLNSDEDFELFITAYTWEPDSSFTVNLDTIYVTVIEVADIPDVFAQGAEGNEDTIIPLTFGGALNDTDGSEVLFFGVNGIPEGSTVSQYYNYRDNAYILLPSQAEVFSVQPPLHDDNDFTLSISAISMENDTVIAISDTTISVIVHAVADVPDLAVTSAQGNEDTDIPLEIITSLVDDDGSESLFLTISGVPVEGTLSAGTDLGNGTYELLIGDLLNLSIHPPEDINEDIDLTVRSITTEVNGGDQTYNELTLPVDVIPVNDFPQMTIADQVTNEDIDFSIPISAYDPDIITDDQIMNFSVSSANETLVTASVVNNRYLDGSVNDAEIWFDVHDDEYGETTISVTVDDDNGGVIVVDFNVLVNPVNDEPSFVVGPDITLDEDDASSDPLHPAEVKIYPGWASEIDVGPSNEDDGHTAGIESNQFPTFTLTTDNDELFNVLPTIDGSGELVFQQEINIYGTAEVSIILVDNGGIEFDGDDTFPVQSFTITINPINDAPYLGNITDRSVLEDNILQLTFEELFSPDDFLEWFVLEVDGDHLTFGANGSEHVIMSSVDGDLISFSPTAEWYGTEEIRVFVTDGAYIDSRHLNVGVQPVNDIPSFVSGENVTVLEDSGVYSQLWATDLNMGPLNESDGHTEGIESNQHPSFVLTAENSNLFIDQPSIDSEGILTFSTAENANGTASVSVVMNDNGGTLNGGIDQTLPIEFTINVSPVNDDPILAELTDIETDEDVNVSIQVSGSDVDMETNGQELTFSCTSSDESLAVCSIEEDQQRGVVTKQLVLTVQENMHGTATIDVMVNDGQGRAIAADNFVLTVNAVPDIPLLSVTDSAGNEDTQIPVDIILTPVDSDGSEEFLINISNIPSNAVLSAGSLQGDGSYSLTTNDLEGLYILPETNNGDDFELIVTATSTETSNQLSVETAPQMIPVTVIAIADEPTILVSDFTTNEDTSVEIQFDARLTDIDGSEFLDFSINNLPDGSSVSSISTNSDTTFIFTLYPPLNDDTDFDITVTVFSIEQENGDTFNIISDPFGITVNAVADPPEITTEAWETDEDTQVTISFVSILTDNDGSESLFHQISGIPEGAAITPIIDDGNNTYSFSITPALNDHTDFDLTITGTSTEAANNSTASSVATIPVLINPINDNPTLNPITDILTYEDIDRTLTVTGGDVDIQTDGQQLTFTCVSNDEVLVTCSASAPQSDIYSTLTLDIQDNRHGSTTIDVSVSDGFNRSVANQSFTVTVEAIADVPDLTVTDAVGDEDTAIPLNIYSELVDTDGSETLHLEICDVPINAELSAGVLLETDCFYLLPEEINNLTVSPFSNSDEDFEIFVRAFATDANGSINGQEKSIFVTVNPVADLPNISATPAEGAEDTAIPLIGQASLNDLDGSETLFIRLSDIPSGATLSTDCSYYGDQCLYLPQELVGLTITPGLNNSDDFVLLLDAIAVENENEIAVNSQVLPVTVDAVADIPTLVTSDGITDEDVPIDITFTSELTDNDGSEILDLIVAGLPDGGSITDILSNGDGTHTFTVTPPLNQHDDFTLTVTSTSTELENGDSAFSSSDIFIEVVPVNDDPVLGELNDVTTDEDVSIIVDISAIDVDIETDGQLLTFGCSSSNEVLVICSVTEPRGEVFRQLELTVQENRHGTSEITVTVNDNFGRAVDSGSFILTVNAVADEPNLSVLPASGDEDTAIPLEITTSLVDTDGSESLVVDITGIPAGSQLSAGTEMGEGHFTFAPEELPGLEIIPPQNSDTDFELTVTATSTDANNDNFTTDPRLLQISINAVADTPILNTIDGITDEDTSVDITFQSYLIDEDGSETLEFVVTGLPDGASITEIISNGDSTYTFSVIPPLNQHDDFTLTVTSTSTELANGDTAFTGSDIFIEVVPVNDAPVLGELIDLITDEDIDVIADISASDVDIETDGQILSFGCSSSDEELVSCSVIELPDMTTAQLSLDVHENRHGISEISVNVTDNAGRTTTSDSFMISVNAVADVPDLQVVNVSGNEDQPVQLQITPIMADIDGSEESYVVISGIPSSGELTSGTLLEDGNYQINETDLQQLYFIPPENISQNYLIYATAYSMETSNGSLASSELKAFHIDIIAVADMPQLTVTDTSTIEDIPVEVIFTSSLTDLDGSESLNVNVSDFQPTGIAVTEITELNGTYSFMVTPALNDHSEIVITVTSETIESDNGDTESVSENIHIDVEAVPDLPILIVENLTMIEDEISQVNFQSGLTDVDGSEILNLSLAGYPEGTVISGFPENTRITDYSFEIQTPENFNGVFEMFITAQAIEQSNSQFTSLVDTIFTSVLAADDPPALGDIPDQTVDGCSQFDSFNWIDLLTEVDGDYVEFSYSGNTELIINVDDTGNVSVSVPQTYWTGTETISFTVTDETDFGLSETLDVVYTINPLQTYYYDLDSDGLGAGDGLEFCPNQAPEDWVSNNDDLQPECPTNDEDICGYCGGENFEDEFGFVTGPNADCLGVCDGTALIDDCGICDGDNSSCNQPVAYDQDIETMENTSIQISLIASDPNEDELSANIINYVSHGQLILTENPLIFDYQPEPGYFGADQFTFTVTDNEWTSDDATVNITVIEVNDPPMGTSYTINLNEDSFSGFDLIGVDEDSPDETLIFTIIQFPLHGMISEGRAVESYTYYPEQNFNGFDELVYEVSDGDTTSQSAVITFNVAAVNDIPIIQGVNYSTGTNEIEENSSVQISVNITDAENDETEILLVSDPNHGELSDFDGSSIMTYFPESGYTGTDQFIIRAREVNTEQHLMSSQFTVNLIIINVNDAPAAFPVSTTVSEDEIDAVIDLSADDPDDDDLTYSISTPAQHGSAQIEGGFLIYTPDLNYNGPDTLEYLAYDGEYYSSPAHVSIMVIPVNDPPQVSDIEFFDVSDGFTFELFPEDVDGDDTYIEFIPQTDEGAGLTLFGAIIERLPDGTFVYHIGFIPTETDFIFYFANDEQSSSDLGVITFNIPDGTFTVSRNVPIATNQIVNLNEDVTTEISLIGADIDNLMDETASIQITQYPQNGNITDPVVDSITADYVTWLTQYTPDLNYYGTDSLKYIVTNPNNINNPVSDEGTILININPVNDIPVLSSIPDQFMDEDTQLNLELNYSDPDDNLLLSYTSSNPSNLNITHIDQQLILTPGANYHGILSVIVTVTEDSDIGLQVSRTFSLTVNSTNDLPIMNPISDIELYEEQSTTITLTANDVDGIENLEYSGSVTSNPDLLGITINGDMLTISPNLNMTGISEISVWVDDGRDTGELSDPAIFNVLIIGVNDSPIITILNSPDPINEDEGPAIITLTPVDVDEGDSLTVSVTTTNSQLFPIDLISIEPGTAESQVQRTISLLPAQNKSGEAIIVITVSDGNAIVTTQVSVTVLEVNDAPIISSITDPVIPEDSSGDLVITATDIEGSPLNYSLLGGVNINSGLNGNIITFTPNANWNGTESFTIAVSDGETFSSANFNVIVSPVNDAPVITSEANTIAYVAMPYSYQIAVDDVDQGPTPFIYQLNNSPLGMTISSDGLISWTPPLGVFTSGDMSVTVTDDGALTASQSFVITVVQIDCAGDYGGTAVIDDCGECTGGNTGLSFNYAMDCEGVCFGDDFTAMDCAGECYGDSYLDSCGICDNDPSNDDISCTGCADPSAMNYVDGNIVDDGSCIYLGDLNADQLVNVVDVIEMVNLILFDLEPDEYQLWVGDLSYDYVIDIHDIVLLVASILGDEGLGLRQSIEEGFLEISRQSIKLSCTGSVSAVDIQIQGEFQIDRNQEHSAGIFNSGSRILIISLDGSDLQNSTIMRFTGELQIISGTIYDWNAKSIQADIIEIPTEFEITDIYPNPFNAETNIRFMLPEETKVTVSIYNLNGRLIDILWDGESSVGSHSVHWDAKMEPSGIYFIKIITPDKLVTRKITLMK